MGEVKLKTNRFYHRTTPVVKDEIAALANRTRRTLSSLLDEAIEDLLEKYKVKPAP